MVIFMRFLFVASVGLVVMLAGCGKAPVPLYPVSGKIMYEGKPLPKGTVCFIPDSTKGNLHPQFGISTIAPDGTYTAKTYTNEGVQPGWYRVKVLATENEPQPSPNWVPIWIVPEKYTTAETPLEVEVVPEPAPGAYDFTLEP